MILLVRQELTKLYRRYAPYVIYALTGLLIVMVVLGIQAHRREMRSGFANPSVEMVGDPTNGLLVCQMVADSISRLLFYLGPVVLGELVGGEAATGTLRTILIRPQSRLRTTRCRMPSPQSALCLRTARPTAGTARPSSRRRLCSRNL